MTVDKPAAVPKEYLLSSGKGQVNIRHVGRVLSCQMVLSAMEDGRA